MKNRTLKIMMGGGITLIILAGASGGPAIILLPLLIIGLVLMVVSLWIILIGFNKVIFLAGTIIGVIGLP
ncbi:MAG: hypothetical protein JSW00_15760 [Thermoplasmata archaeon]|nr:MAG: hypothetical protein JSW00_15760 [Thermoplasmata archaeon]